MKPRNALSILFVLLLVLSITACSGEGVVAPSSSDSAATARPAASEATKKVEEAPDSPERVVLTAAIADKTNVEDFNTNAVTMWVNETLNVELQFNVYASADYNDKINLMISSGDTLEDIIFGGFSDTLVYGWAKIGALTPLTEYYADASKAPNLYEAMERVGSDFRGAMVMPDGEIYYVPQFNNSYGNECGSKVWIYQPWLDALSAKAPATTGEFEELLKKAVATDLNGNGKADEIGLAGYDGVYGQWFSYLMNAFVYTDYNNNFMKLQNGVLSYSFAEDAWREGLEWISGMVADGLLPTETVTQDNSSWKTMLNTADITAFTFAYFSSSQITDTEVKGEYVALAPLTGPNGVRYTQFNPSKPSCAMLITADCEAVDRAFAVGDLLVCEENSITTRFGARGQDWDYLSDLDNPGDYTSPYPGFDAYIVVHDDSNFWGSGSMQNRSWMQIGPYIRQYGIANGMGVNPDTVSKFSMNEAAGICLYQQGGYFPDETIIKLIYNDEETVIVSEVSATLKAHVEETLANWLLGNQPLNDTTWQAFLDTAETIGAANLLECAQAAYNRSL